MHPQGIKAKFELSLAGSKVSGLTGRTGPSPPGREESFCFPKQGLGRAWPYPLLRDLPQAWCTQLLGTPQAAGPGKWGRPCRTLGTWGARLSSSSSCSSSPWSRSLWPCDTTHMSSHVCAQIPSLFLPPSFTKHQRSGPRVSTHRHSLLLLASPARGSYFIYEV